MIIIIIDHAFPFQYFIGEIRLYHYNYTHDYILYPKFFEFTFYTLNYNPCYTLNLNVKFAVNLDGKAWSHMKMVNFPFYQSLKKKKKNKGEITFYHPKLYS